MERRRKSQQARDQSDTDRGAARRAESGSSLEALVRREADGSLAGAATPQAEREMLLALQRSAGNAAVNRLLRTLAPPEAGPDEAAAGVGRSVIVADDGPAPEPGQMHRGEFLDALKSQVSAAAQDALTSPVFAVTGCPWIEHWVEHYRGRPPDAIEQAVARYAPGAARARTADAVIAAICARVREGIALWEESGELPAAAAQDGVAPAPADAEPPVAFKLREGVTADRIDGREMQRRLGPGRPLDDGSAARMGSALGADVGHVRVHDDPASGRLAIALGARAFAVGRDVVFGPNEHAPGTPLGDALMAHELAHVVQQDGASAAAGASARSLEEDADLAALGALTVLHGGAGGRPGVGPALRSGLQLQRCPATQTGVRAPTAAGGIPEPAYTPAAPGTANKMDARATAIQAGAAAARSWQEGGVQAVRAIISTYFASEADKIEDVKAETRSGENGLRTEAFTRPDAKGTINVSERFAIDIGTTNNFSRYVLSVGHEILHVNQQRAGMGGPGRQHEREFLAHHWTATSPEAEGTGRMSPQTRVGTIDEALRHYNQMTDDQKARHQAEREELLDLRRRERARARNRASIPENPP